MAALAAARQTKSRSLGKIHYVPLAVDIAYAGGAAMINAAGYAAPAAADAGNAGCWGAFTETVDNSGGSAGTKSAQIQEGTFLFAATSIAQTSLGLAMYFTDDQTFDETQGANEPQGGKLVELVSSTSGWVEMSVANAS